MDNGGVERHLSPPTPSFVLALLVLNGLVSY